MRVTLLGGFSVSVGARTIEADDWRLKKGGDLVKLLALVPGHRMHRERAMYLLWPELGSKAASNNLRQALYAARQALVGDETTSDASHYLHLEGELLVLCPYGILWVDVDAFEATATAARRSREPAAYRAALNLYVGDLLPEDRYADWAEERRAQLRQNYLILLAEMAKLFEERGNLGAAIDTLRETVSKEPAYEEAHAHLMRLYARTGQRYQALRQYELLREALQRRFSTEPGATSQSLYEEIVSGRVPLGGLTSSENIPPKRAPYLPRHNVPDALSRFVGREREMVEVERALAMTRLLTLTGAGGSGKTRLALEVTRELAGTYPDGAWLVELASLSNPELLPQTAATALSVRERSERSDQPFITSLINTLRSKEILLVLDNCEHLVDACAYLAEILLGSCPGLRILATSREALGLVGEATWVVPPLPVPEPERPTTLEQIAASESVLLFLDRARYRQPTFALSAENVSAVKEVCRRLDGIPLAIELAAARIGTISVEQIAARLEDPLGLLTVGSRTATPRQRTLRAALKWSYDLLSGSERSLFARLSVFAGGWTLEAAEAVSSGEGIGEEEVLDLLSRLVDKSLVVAEAADEGEVRYGMLEPIRQYAREQLAASGEGNELRRRHAAYFLVEAEAAEPELLGPRQQWWMDRLEREHDNLRLALGWSLERAEELELRLGGALSRFWYARGYLSEGRRWLEQGLTVVGGAASAPIRAKALGEAGWLSEAQGDYEQAKVAHQASLDIYRSLGIEKDVANSLRNLGSVASSQGDYGRATELLEESLTLLRRTGTDTDIVRVLTALGTLAISQGELTRAEKWFEEALFLARKSGDVRGVAVCLNNVGHATLVRGDPERARALFEEALAKDREVGEAQGTAISLINLGLAALTLGDHGRATGLFIESLTLLRDIGNKEMIVECLEALAGVTGARGQAQRAARLWGAAQGLREEIGAPLPSDELAMLDPHLATARFRLDEAIWEAALAEGKTIGLEDSIEYALTVEKPSPPASSAPKQPSNDQPSAVLTRREREVAALVTQGMSNRQIAQELFLSEHTVKRHISKILRKLGLASRAEVAAWATEGLPLTPPFE